MWNGPFQIGRLQFLELLDRGGMAEVYRVKAIGAEGFEKELAVKRIFEGGGPEAAKRFADEARLCSTLTHPNICQVFDFIASEGEHLLVMEYVHGRNLARVLGQLGLRQQRLPVSIALYIGSEVCKGLDYAHAKTDPQTGASLHIIHRDISPQNVMVSFDGAVKLLDFGIARADTRSFHTENETIRGKIAYMSPEQVAGAALDQLTDIFSLGIVLYEMVTGKPLFAAESPTLTIDRIRDCIIPLTDCDPPIEPSLQQILKRCLAKEPTDRYPNAGELQAALQGELNLRYPHFTPKELRSLMLAVFPDELRPRQLMMPLRELTASGSGNVFHGLVQVAKTRAWNRWPTEESAPVAAEGAAPPPVPDEGKHKNLRVRYLAPENDPESGGQKKIVWSEVSDVRSLDVADSGGRKGLFGMLATLVLTVAIIFVVWGPDTAVQNWKNFLVRIGVLSAPTISTRRLATEHPFVFWKCRGDIARYCAGRNSERAIVGCLAAHRGHLSAACAASETHH